MDVPEKNIESARERIIEAVKSGSLSGLLDVLQEIDRLLTDPNRTLGTAPHSGSLARTTQREYFDQDVQSFLNRVKEDTFASLKIDLGDGGMSRLFIDFEPDKKEQPYYIDVGRQNASSETIRRWDEMNGAS